MVGLFFEVEVMVRYFPYLLVGAITSLWISVVAVLFGTILGLFLALGKLRGNQVIKGIVDFYLWIVRGTPMLLQLFLLYYGLPQVGVTMGAVEAAVLGMSLNAAAFKAEIIRAGIEAVPKGQVEAAFSVGMTYPTALRRIILPQAVRTILPPYIGNSIALLKNSSLISVITVNELMLTAQRIYTATYKPIEILSAAGLLYLVMVTAITALQNRVERKWSYSR